MRPLWRALPTDGDAVAEHRWRAGSTRTVHRHDSTSTLSRARIARPSSKQSTPFAARHIGTSAADQQRMLDALGYASLDDLLADAVPAGIREKLALALPPAASEAEAAAELRALAARNQVLTSMIGLGYYGTHHPAGDPPQRAGEPGLVHRVHALPAGDQPGPAGGAAQLPDHGRGPHRAAGRRRVGARRGHRGRRGDGARAPRRPRPATPSSSTPTCCRRRSRWSAPGPSRSASTSSSTTSTRPLPDGRRLRRAGAVPGRVRRGPRPARRSPRRPTSAARC